jgi:hypothetical protein
MKTKNPYKLSINLSQLFDIIITMSYQPVPDDKPIIQPVTAPVTTMVTITVTYISS